MGLWCKSFEQFVEMQAISIGAKVDKIHNSLNNQIDIGVQCLAGITNFYGLNNQQNILETDPLYFV